MTTLNKIGIDLARPYEIHAVKDVTGFGLMGHAREMALASGVQLFIEVSVIPLLQRAIEAVRLGAVPAGLLLGNSRPQACQQPGLAACSRRIPGREFHASS